METSNTHGTLTAGNPLRDPEEQFAEIRQKIVDGMHLCIKDATHALQFPDILERAIENRIWEFPRRYGGAIAPPMKLEDFVVTPYPKGLGTTVEIIEKLIAGNEKVMSEWEKAWDVEPKSAPNPTGIGGKSGKKPPDIVKPDNILPNNNQKKSVTLDYGTSALAGLRRLRKASEAGDEKAADMLSRVLDPNDPTTVNSAAVIMGWRKPMISVVNTFESIADASVKKGGALKTVQRAWAKANQEEREEIATWVDQQMSPLLRSRLL